MFLSDNTMMVTAIVLSILLGTTSATTTAPASSETHSAGAIKRARSEHTPSAAAQRGNTTSGDRAATETTQRKSFGDPDVILPFTASVLVAIGGWIVAWVVTKRTTEISSRQRDEDRVFDSLKLLSEGSQARGIALGLIEAYWDEMPRFRRAWATVIANQAIHLLTQSEERNSFVELDNLHRIFDLLERRDHDSGKPAYRQLLTSAQRHNLHESLRLASHPEAMKRGVKVEYRFAGLWYLRLWGIPDEKIEAYLDGEKSVFDIRDDIDENAFDRVT